MGARLVSIQGVRGAAASLVVFSHAVSQAGWAVPINLAGVGHIGVDLFFVISGLVMVLAHGEDFGHSDRAGAFLRRRLVRIVPIYWLLTSLALALLMVAPQVFTHRTGADPVVVLGSYLFVPVASADGVRVPLLGVGWTLNYEMLFYACLAALMGLSLQRALTALFAVFGLAVLVGAVLEPDHPALQMVTSPLLLEFALGAGLGWLWLRRPAVVRRVAPLGPALLVVALGLGLARSPAGGFERLVAWGIPAAIFVAWALTWTPQDRTGVLRKFGDASYSIYLVQVFSLPGIALALGWMGVTSAAVIVALTTLGSICAGVLFWAFVERPITRALGRRVNRPAAA